MTVLVITGLCRRVVASMEPEHRRVQTRVGDVG